MSWTDTVLARFAAGEISREIALAQLLLSGEAPDPDTLPAPLAELARAQRDRLPGLAALAARGFDSHGVADTATLFDRLAAEAPEAGVAFYTLGDPALLAAATDELAAVIRAWVPVEGRDLLDFGCGFGRVALALAPSARSVLGVDVSGGMVEQARARAAGQPHLRFERVESALPLPDAGVDLIVAADCFPFLVREGVVPQTLAEFARVLRPGGDLLVFNWSYRGDEAQDITDARDQGAAAGFTLLRAGERPFAIWDGRAFQFRRA